LSAAFDQGQVGCGILWQEPFMAKADQPVGYIISTQPDVFGPEFLASAPVADAHIDQDSLAREHVEELGV